MAMSYKSYWRADDETASKNKGGAEASLALAGRVIGQQALVGSGESLVGQTVKLSEAESRHLVKAFRARVGDAVTLFDAAGSVWQGELAVADGRGALVRIGQFEQIAAPQPQITLVQAMPKGKTMDSVIAAMVELGAVSIVPLATENSEVRIEKDRARMESKCEHWQQTSIEASKQSSNFYGTRIEPIVSLREFLQGLPPLPPVSPASPLSPTSSLSPRPSASPASPLAAETAAKAGGQVQSEIRIIGSLEKGSVPLAALATEIAEAGRVVCLIGPEGDFSPAEYALARAHGFRPVRLAAHVLRVKTAATYIVSTIDALARAAR